ncbi:uncharacterized protein BJ212DRAFT_769550 [Suillus subaureus]|uniref:Secreted protein n=1 Tax=Suillus subaureus TaxID=48587 RepID=A0A9P7DGK0_9AGAM|nr:uncharacterized protein BJ212DRAFT_769550 [Suillus subaureus]KAG1793380.1 hypothetical protein BJ212DRAFT_769550 [Suillus subaureus]
MCFILQVLFMSLASRLVISLQKSWCAALSLTSACNYCSSFLQNSNSIGVRILSVAVQILLYVQMFVLGPRLILSVRESHVKFVANSNAETSMNSIVFQERVHVPTSSTV